jgi:predicted ATP-dependent endonuclease of OLD family
LELHLHPPQQQTLLNALRELGRDCQWLITTHSPYLEEIIPDQHEVRIGEGGVL